MKDNDLTRDIIHPIDIGATATLVGFQITIAALNPQVPPGYIYDLRTISICPDPLVVNNVLTTVTVDLSLHVGQPTQIGPGQVNAATFVDSPYPLGSSGTIPITAVYERGQIPIRNGEQLFVVFGKVAGGATAQIMASCGRYPI